MLIVGTAGHIDHGKSAIVRRLTGTDPDRLPEERERGMTIDLGFAFYHTHSGQEIALIDVPGHERFVKNMIAGAGGIDSVMLVIAADDGWMPQSQEHFQIVRLLGVQHGIVVINKTDLAEPDWLDLLEAEVTEKVAGSFLENAPVFRVSAETGEGFDKLADYLEALPAQIASRRDTGKARLFIDRSFVRPGMGGVVTGTLRGGHFDVGQTIAVWPSRRTAKIRTLQSQNQDVSRAEPGQRTAVSLTGVDKELLLRGGVLSARTNLDYFNDNPVLVLNVEMLSEAPVPLRDGRKAEILVGTTEIDGEIRLFETDQLNPGETGIAFFRPTDPVYALVGDRCILRLPTPMVTLGGGQILDHVARFPRRKDLPSFSYIQERTGGELSALIISELRKVSLIPPDQLLQSADVAADAVAEHVAVLLESGRVASLSNHVFLVDHLDSLISATVERVARQLKRREHVTGLTLEDLLRLLPLERNRALILIDHMLKLEKLTRKGELYNLPGAAAGLKGVIKEAHDKILAALGENPFAPPGLAEFSSRGKIYQQAIKFMLDNDEVHKCGADFLFLAETWNEIVAFIRRKLTADGSMAVADLRDKFGFTRKFVIPVLEETDRLGLTRRQGDVRVPGDSL